MYIKNKSQQHTNNKPKKNTIKSIANGTLILANILLNSQQATVSADTLNWDIIQPNTKSLLVKNIRNVDDDIITITLQHASQLLNATKDTIDYADMARFPIKWIIKHYGQEKAIEIFQQTLLMEVNKVRKENWVNALVLNPLLTKSSQNFAEEMFETKRFSHTGKHGDDVSKRAKKAWYQWKVDEDIWADFYTIEDGIAARKDSPDHFNAMINPEWKDLWVGSGWGLYWVLMFGK